MRRHLVLAACLAALACTARPSPHTPADIAAACATACAHLEHLGCETAQPTPAGESCSAVCESTESSGWTSMHPECIPLATTCDAADSLSMWGCAIAR
jgi:hypothetical protein